MIKKYFRPQNVEEALALLTDAQKNLTPLGGGTSVSRHQEAHLGVVDLQDTSLDQITVQGQRIQVGAMVRLNDLMGHADIHSEIQRAIMIDASENIRNMATLGGWLVSSTGRSIISCVLLAMDTSLTWEPGNKRVPIGNWLPLREVEPPGVLITEAEWWLRPHLAFEYVARSPKDKPTLIVAVAQWG
ncbi:MAG: FAD binding domain-containing protein, partial [Chloroflexota bacterium]|nr:FAD binding domain-containing protein [Chloroflexota bacterium]